MRTLSITTTAVLALALASTVANGASTIRTAACGSGVGPTEYSTTKTIKGKMIVFFCGPASARMHYKGKTYTFKHGTCFHYLGSFKLNLGTAPLLPAPNNGGYSSLTVNTGPGGHFEVGMGVGKISIYGAAKSSGVGVKGTFSSTTNGLSFAGSWNCGGPIRKH